MSIPWSDIHILDHQTFILKFNDPINAQMRVEINLQVSFFCSDNQGPVKKNRQLQVYAIRHQDSTTPPTSFYISVNELKKVVGAVESFTPYYETITFESTRLEDLLQENNLLITKTPQIQLGIDAHSIVITDSRKLVIGRSYDEHIVYMSSLYSGFPHWAVLTQQTQNIENTCICLSLYLGSALILLGREGYNSVIANLKDCVEAGQIELKSKTQQEINNFIMSIDSSRIAYHAFIGLISITKTGSPAQFIKPWLDRRLSAYFTRLGTNVPQPPGDITLDVLIIGKFLDDKIQLRSALYAYFVYNNQPPIELIYKSNIYDELRNQVSMVTENTGLITFMLCYYFSVACETEAHTLIEVCRQSNHVIESYDWLIQLCATKNYPYSHYYLFNARDARFEVARYPDLAYCAITRIKATGAASWQNFSLGELPIRLTANTLCEKTARLLASTQITEASGDQLVVTEYLQRYNKQINTNLTNIAPLPPLKFTQIIPGYSGPGIIPLTYPTQAL